MEGGVEGPPRKSMCLGSSPLVTSTGMRTLSQAPAEKVLNSSGRVRVRFSKSCPIPPSSPIP